MKYEFSAKGHKNILSTHKTTLEITKDKDLTKNGDCIIATHSNHDINSIIKLIKNKKNIKITLKIDNSIEIINSTINPNFNNPTEIVVRKSDFTSNRTLGINSDKSAIEIKKDIKTQLKDPNSIIDITFETE